MKPMWCFFLHGVLYAPYNNYFLRGNYFLNGRSFLRCVVLRCNYFLNGRGFLLSCTFLNGTIRVQGLINKRIPHYLEAQIAILIG